jgi:gamma-glutamylcyclotransferase (GGCT)/AIG2-like uncharacterized protein YtfP
VTVPVHLLFAYGTLMRGYPLHPVLARGATYLGPGRVSGTLLDLGSYPGLVDGGGPVTGEVYRIDTPELLPVVDEQEGYNFQRRRRRVALPDDGRAWAWVYHYRGARERVPVIAHGDYRRARPPRASGPSRRGRRPLARER